MAKRSALPSKLVAYLERTPPGERGIADALAVAGLGDVAQILGVVGFRDLLEEFTKAELEDLRGPVRRRLLRELEQLREWAATRRDPDVPLPPPEGMLAEYASRTPKEEWNLDAALAGAGVPPLVKEVLEVEEFEELFEGYDVESIAGSGLALAQQKRAQRELDGLMCWAAQHMNE